ncbi:MAG: YdcF family protein, partial [candidate division Zixibacteria bacterium]|nr:YdcF family protein [candidate division Zixibacteria bacterium]
MKNMPKAQEKENMREALRRIAKAKKSNSESLDLSRLNLTSIPHECWELSNLIHLYIYDNYLTEIPPEIGKLTNLTLLSIGGNQLTQLPPEIGKLSNLTGLYNRDNQLTEFPSEIGKLSNLTTLYAFGNQLTELPPEIGKLSNLTRLDISGNQLAELPREIVKLSNLTKLHLHGNPLKLPPMAVCNEGINAIRAYFANRTTTGESKRYEAKLMLVGEGSVGKTCLSKAMRGLKPDARENRTLGILIDEWTIVHPDEPDTEMVLNIWDYEGQEISRTTHQFFYSSDSLYLVVFNGREGHDKGNLNFWFEIISARAPGARVILVATECEKTTPDFDFSYLSEQFKKELSIYPQVIHVDSFSKKNLAQLKEVIIEQALALDVMGMNWTVGWTQVEEQVIKLRDKGHVKISRQELYSIMESIGVRDSDKDSVTGMLDKFGIITHFPDHEDLRNEIILNPEWLTTAISRFIEDGDVVENNGVFSKSDIDRVWSNFSENDRLFFYRCMEGFELCYRHPLSDDRFLPLRFANQPIDEIRTPIEDSSTRRARYAFKFLPSALFPRFIVNTHHYSTGIFWRNGVLLEERDEKTGEITKREKVEVGMESKMRALGAIELMQRGLVDRIIVTGGIAKEFPDEKSIAEAIEEYLVKKGVPPQKILKETKSKNTAENIENILAILEKEGISKVLLETNEFHLPRAKQLFGNIMERHGLSVEEAEISAGRCS